MTCMAGNASFEGGYCYAATIPPGLEELKAATSHTLDIKPGVILRQLIFSSICQFIYIDVHNMYRFPKVTKENYTR